MRSSVTISFLSLCLATFVPALTLPPKLNERQLVDIGPIDSINSVEPKVAIYPQKGNDDAPYSVDEGELRSAIQIPSDFNYGKGSEQPVLLVPGTAIPAEATYEKNLIKLLTNSTFADPVWVNIPGSSLADAQVNSEYVAYALNYVSSISENKSISVISWSQGGLDLQWSFKYWPSTIGSVENVVALSPDFRGTTEAILLCNEITGGILCPPSVNQQQDTSAFVETLRRDGGDSAYVPTTTFYSSTDEIVQPMSGENASAYLLDERNVGVSNNQVQTLCDDDLMIVLHEGALYNAVAWGLIEDAITKGGVADPNRIDLESLCEMPQADGLTSDDALGTEAVMVQAVTNILDYQPKVEEEPPIAAYA